MRAPSGQKKESQNTQMHCRISPRKMRNPCSFIMKLSSRYQRLFIYDVKRNTKIDGMGPFNIIPIS